MLNEMQSWTKLCEGLMVTDWISSQLFTLPQHSASTEPGVLARQALKSPPCAENQGQ